MVAGGIYVAVRTLPVKDYLLSFLEWTQQLKQQHLLVAAVAFVLTYVVATVFMLPGSVLTLGAGFLFGLLGGTVLVSIASTLGACASFLIGRTVARGWVERRVAGNRKFEAIDEAVGRQGFRIVLLVRLSPIFPFNLQNYGFGLTRVAFWRYALASWIGMIPGTVMYVYFGAGLNSLVQAAAGEVERTTAQRVAFWVGLGVAIFVAVYVARIARNALKRAVEDTEAGAEAMEEGQ
jgi:uncharacterized membrane protein YdjX (TVP38/TMEM64 family)